MLLFKKFGSEDAFAFSGGDARETAVVPDDGFVEVAETGYENGLLLIAPVIRSEYDLVVFFAGGRLFHGDGQAQSVR